MSRKKRNSRNKKSYRSNNTSRTNTKRIRFNYEFHTKVKKDLNKDYNFIRRPKWVLERNFLGIPVAVRITNITPVQARINDFRYKTSFGLKRLIVCARRAIRREVLFAKGGAGKGKKVRSKRIYTDDSKIKC